MERYLHGGVFPAVAFKVGLSKPFDGESTLQRVREGKTGGELFAGSGKRGSEQVVELHGEISRVAEAVLHGREVILPGFELVRHEIG